MEKSLYYRKGERTLSALLIWGLLCGPDWRWTCSNLPASAALDSRRTLLSLFCCLVWFLYSLTAVHWAAPTRCTLRLAPSSGLAGPHLLVVVVTSQTLLCQFTLPKALSHVLGESSNYKHFRNQEVTFSFALFFVSSLLCVRPNIFPCVCTFCSAINCMFVNFVHILLCGSSFTFLYDLKYII